MGCDIHLRLERKLLKEKVWNEFYTERPEDGWKSCGIFGMENCWSDRVYGMFALLSDVKNYNNSTHIPIRGFPDDASNATKGAFCKRVVDKKREDCDDWEFSFKRAEEWVEDGYSKFYKINGALYCSIPDYHSPNWCTTQEMEECINRLFKDENGKYKGDYIEWLALLGAMKGYEESGEYQCRAVFWFDS